MAGAAKGTTLAENTQIERCAHELVISRSTRRPGDLAHFVLAPIGVALGGVVLFVGLQRGTLFDSWFTVVLLLAVGGYGWFALTRAVNRRTLTLGVGGLSVMDGPCPSLARRINAGVDEVGEIKARSSMRFTFPMISRYRVHHVEASGVEPPLFRSLADEAEATRIQAALVSFLA